MGEKKLCNLHICHQTTHLNAILLQNSLKWELCVCVHYFGTCAVAWPGCSLFTWTFHLRDRAKEMLRCAPLSLYPLGVYKRACVFMQERVCSPTTYPFHTISVSVSNSQRPQRRSNGDLMRRTGGMFVKREDNKKIDIN